MKSKISVGIIVVLSIMVVSGCSYIPKKIADLNPFKKPTESVVDKKPETPPAPARELSAVINEVNAIVDEMVADINDGNWAKAITLGEKGRDILNSEPSFKKAVKESVYLTESIREKLYETLIEAYDYKNRLEGLSAGEKEKYVQAAKAHLEINTAEPFKKLALAKVLLDTGKTAEGLQLANEVNNSPVKNKDTAETYAWGLYVSGKKTEAYNLYKNIYAQSETLLQLYHSAVAIEEYDKTLGLKLYKNCLAAGNNLMVKEENLKNQSAQSYINKIMDKSQKAIDRLLAGGFGVDSQFKGDNAQNIVQAIVKL